MFVSRSEAEQLRKKRRQRRFRKLMYLNVFLLVVLIGVVAYVMIGTSFSGKSLGASQGAQPSGKAESEASSGVTTGNKGEEASSDEGTTGNTGEEASSDEGTTGNTGGTASPDVGAGGESGAGGDSDSGANNSGTGADNDPAGNPADNSAEGTVPAGDEDVVRMTFVGDVLLDGTVAAAMKKSGYDYPYVYARKFFEEADISLANLETPVTTKGVPAEDKQFVFKTAPEALPEMLNSGIDIVNLANNHVLDQGTQGMLDTIAHLDAAGIQHIGAGSNAEEAYAPIIVEKKGIKIAFLGLTRVIPKTEWKAGPKKPGVAETYSSVLPVQAIKRAKEEADLVVIMVHWGKERYDKPVAHQLQLAKEFIDAGADLIIGSHPHVLQGLERYKGKWIAYSLGNFIFTTSTNAKTWETGILQASCRKDGGCELTLVPMLTKNAQPALMDRETGQNLFRRIESISEHVAITDEGHIISTDGKGETSR